MVASQLLAVVLQQPGRVYMIICLQSQQEIMLRGHRLMQHVQQAHVASSSLACSTLPFSC